MGLAVWLQWLASLGRWMESHTLAHLPFYRAVKLAARALIGTASEEIFFGGILHNQDGSEELVYIIEEFQDGRMAILVPFAPASFTGSAKIVDATRVTRLEAGAGEISNFIAHWGVGTAEALEVPLKE